MKLKITLLLIISISTLPAIIKPDTQTTFHKIMTQELPSGTYQYIDQELLIQPADGVSISELNSVLYSYGAYIERIQDLEKYGFALVVLPPSMNLMQVRNLIKSNPLIRTANLNYVGTFATGEPVIEDPLYGDQWALLKIEALRGWGKYPQGSSPVVVAILDSGYSGHEDLDSSNPRIIQNASKFNLTDAPYYGDDQDHAMGIAGIVAAETNNDIGIAGVAWYPKLWFIKVGKSTDDGKGYVACN